MAEVVAALFQDNQTRIVLQDAGADVSISYLDQDGDAPKDRLSPYFRDATVNKKTWESAAIEALDEYFSVAGQSLRSKDQSKLHDLTVRWHRHRASIVGHPVRRDSLDGDQLKTGYDCE